MYVCAPADGPGRHAGPPAPEDAAVFVLRGYLRVRNYYYYYYNYYYYYYNNYYYYY